MEEKLLVWLEKNQLPTDFIDGRPRYAIGGNAIDKEYISYWRYDVPMPSSAELNALTLKSEKEKRLERLQRNELWPYLKDLIEKSLNTQ